MLVVIDGANALQRTVTDVFEHPIIQRCQLHKLRSVTDRVLVEGERPHTMADERWRWSDLCSSGGEECRKRAFPWTSRDRFPSASTVGGDLGERLLAQRFPGVASHRVV